jgi:protein SCO1/2
VLQRISFVLAFTMLLISCEEKARVPFYNTADFTPYWKGDSDFSVDTFHTIAPFKFIDQEGAAVTNKMFDGKIYVADFFFTICPGICPKLTGNMAKISEEFRTNDNVLFISHSVTPDIDSVQQLKKYAVEHNIDASRWHLVTGDKDKIYELARRSYFAERDIGFQNSKNEFLHTEHFILVDRNGHIRGIYNGTLDLETDRLIDDIRILLDE